MDDDALAGKRILVVEDEAAVAMLIESMLEDMGCAVVANVATVDTALAAVRAGGFDAAVLDMNLAGERADPVAEALRRAGIPFAFASGYGDARRPVGGGPGEPIIAKPFRSADLDAALRQVVAAADAAPPRHS